MNTTEIVAKLRAQAAELTAMADALEESTATAAFASGAGRYLIHGEVKVGDWTTYAEVPFDALAEDTEGDYFVKTTYGRTWVWCNDGEGWQSVGEGSDGDNDCITPNLRRCHIVALGLTGHETATDIRNLVERFKAQVPA